MLQKVLVVLVGVVMSLVGALSPSGLFAAQPSVELTGFDATNAADEPVATVRTLDGQAFARVSVLWVEVDGRRVLDDAWGTGAVDELRFKVGVKDVEGLALSVGSKMVPLRPTDVLTVRMFHGDFAFRDMGTAKATLQLQGAVKSALVNEGNAGSRLRTEINGTAGNVIEAPEGGAREVSYVVLNTGQKVETVAIQDGGARLFTEEAADRASAANVPGNLLAKWVKVDGKLLQEYTWGDGVVSTIEFEPADAGKGGVILAYNGESSQANAGTRVLVKDFVGEYLVYQVAGGLVRLRLDGYAGEMNIGAVSALPVQLGEGAPTAMFDYTPTNPKTTDTIRFTDRSTDDTMVVFRMWRFGDEGTSVLPNPTFRFTEPGQYLVTLNVTDTDRQYSETNVTITVGNAEPVPDFDFWPKIITTQTTVAFTDSSVDTDGRVVNWTWRFGDGGVSYHRHPTHEFTQSGPVTVTLAATDDLGGRAEISKVIQVRNTPPVARFNYSPNDVTSLVRVQFQDQSEDPDGTIVRREWRFGDGANASGAAPVHMYQRPGLYTVSLTVTDSAGDSDTTSTQIYVRNRLPIVDFSWTPNGAPADHPVHFTSLAVDPDGQPVVHEWSFGDGTVALEQNPTHFYQRAGSYNVTLTITDNSLERNSTTKLVNVSNAVPRVAISISPNPAFRGQEITFADVTTDADGDQIVNRTWRFPNETIYGSQVVRRTFEASGDYPISLTVRDAAGSVGMTNTTVRIVNRPPVLDNITISPSSPVVGSPVTFTASGRDLDARPGDPPLTYEWRFSDGAIAHGAVVNRTFDAPIRITTTLHAIDSEGARSNPLTSAAVVDYARPVANFFWSPGPPDFPMNVQQIRFESTSTSLNGPITSWRWDFKDGTSGDGPVVNKSYASGGTYFVKLTVTDNLSRSNSIEMPVVVNNRPTANFEVDPLGVVPRNSPVAFTDRSGDVDGDLIQTWHWDFEDGTSNEQNPVHNFTTPGRHNVTLTVTDARGGVGTVTKVVRVHNERPVARWSVEQPVIAGETAQFHDLSSDPDNTPIQSWQWTFGDGATSTLQSPTHTYALSGRYTVTLVANDGELASRIEPGAYGTVSVRANHSVNIDVRGRLPDDRPADLTAPEYLVRARLTQPGGGYTDFPGLTHNGTNLTLNLPRGTWMRGDVITVTVEAPRYFEGTLAKQYTLSDPDGLTRSVLLDFEIPMPIKPVVTPAAGNANTLQDVPVIAPNQRQTPEGDPVYRSMTEAFHGTGSVQFKDGTPAYDATVVIEARYLPVRPVGALRDALGVEHNTLLGWCRAATSPTDVDGNFTWVITPQSSECAFDDSGVHPVGRWEIRASVTFSFAQAEPSDVKTVYVDPTGGLLWAAAMPP